MREFNVAAAARLVSNTPEALERWREARRRRGEEYESKGEDKKGREGKISTF